MPAAATFELDDPVQSIEDMRAAQAVGEANSHADLIALDKRDYLKLIVGTYVHGFNEFDTSIWTSDELVKVGIYYNPNEQDERKAEQLAERFREQLPLILGEPQYQWANDVGIEVSVHNALTSETSD